MHSSPLRASSAFSNIFDSPAARIKRGTADQSGFADALGLASVHTIYPRRRRSRLSQLVRSARAALLPALGGVAAAYILIMGVPVSPSHAETAAPPAIEAGQ